MYGIFCLHSVAVARYAAFIQAKSPVNCDAHLAEDISFCPQIPSLCLIHLLHP
ncbi:DUF6783 domain-containing protein [Anaerobutyricum hallii]|uniref:DUF6783 domain-containing protein n=1 Tax=Anaerobutyricum hallii TaxID=39488 RepID=UPI002FE6CE71